MELLCDNVGRFAGLGVCLTDFWDFAVVCCSDFVCCLFRFWFVCFGCLVFCLWFVILAVWIVIGLGLIVVRCFVTLIELWCLLL